MILDGIMDIFVHVFGMAVLVILAVALVTATVKVTWRLW